MQPLSIQDTAQKIQSLNSDQNPYQYIASANSIVGNWKIADVKWVAILGAGTIDKEYSITVTLDEPTHTYTFNEHKKDGGSKLSFNMSTGNLSFGKSSSTFSGKMIGKEFGAGAGTAVVQDGQPGNTYNYSFDTNKIKEPLFATLEQCGYKQKKTGFLNKLFGH